jgi:uncharacterized protein (DUF342 family)
MQKKAELLAKKIKADQERLEKLTASIEPFVAKKLQKIENTEKRRTAKISRIQNSEVKLKTRAEKRAAQIEKITEITATSNTVTE